MRNIAVIAGTIAGLGIAATWFRRATRTRRSLIAAAPAAIACIVALALAGGALITLSDQTIAFSRAGQTEIGRVPTPMPEALVRAARKELRPGETWTLYTSFGRCRDDALRYYWLAFRLLPNVAKCEGTPSVIIAFRIDDLVHALGKVVARTKDWAVVRP